MILIYFIAGLICAFIGAGMARSRGRDSAVWGLICFLFPLLGLFVLAISGDAPRPVVIQQAASSNGMSAPVSKKEQPESMRESTAWKTLLEFDPDIQHAVGAIKKYGSPAEERLAKAFLSVKDKSLLPNMTAKISEDFERQELAKAERAKVIASAGSNNSAEPVEISPDHGYRSDAQARIVKDREKRSIAMMDDIEQNGMICRYTNKTVSDMSIYFGASRDDHGYAKLVYTDGTAELRSGQFFMACRKELE